MNKLGQIDFHYEYYIQKAQPTQNSFCVRYIEIILFFGNEILFVNDFSW